MWRENLLRLICFSFSGGIVQGIVGDFLYLVSYLFSQAFKLKRTGTREMLLAMRDIVLGVSAGCVMLVVHYYGNNGRFRLSSVFFAMLSFVTYRLSVGRLLRFVIKRCVDFLFKLFVSVFNRFYKIVKNVWSFFSEKIKKILEIYKNKRRLEVEKRKDNKLGRDKKRSKGAFCRGKPRVAKKCKDSA